MQHRARTIENIRIDDIVVDAGPRPIDDAAVAQLARSMHEIGLHTPIVVIFDHFSDDGRGGNNRRIFRVVTGRHRIAAARSLGWSEIEAVRFDDSEYVAGLPEDVDLDVLAEMWAIAENLHRADLTKDQRDAQIRRYAELLTMRETGDANCVGSLADGRKAGPQHRPGVASQIAEETGVSKDTVRRALNPERARVEREKNADRKALRAEAEEKLAQLLAEYVPGELWDALKANLHAVGCKNVARELERLVGVSVFDRTAIGSREVHAARENVGRMVVPHDPETGEILDSEVNAKLVATVAAGMQTEIGRKALVTALDVMIEREENETRSGGLVSPSFPELATRSADKSVVSNHQSEDGVIAAVNAQVGLADANGVEASSSETNPEAKASDDNAAISTKKGSPAGREMRVGEAGRGYQPATSDDGRDSVERHATISPETATRPGQDVQSPSQRALAGENLDVTAGETAPHSQSDDGAIAAVNGKARLANADGVEPSSSEQCAAHEKDAAADERDVEATVEQRSSASIPDHIPAFLTAPVNEWCLKQGNCRFDRHPQKITCSDCSTAWETKKREVA